MVGQMSLGRRTLSSCSVCDFFFNDTATTEIYTLSLHDALPIWAITKQGNAHLRGILIEIAWRARAKAPDLARHYDQLSTRMGGKRAIVAIARKLIGRIRAAFRKGELYQTNYQSDLATTH